MQLIALEGHYGIAKLIKLPETLPAGRGICVLIYGRSEISIVAEETVLPNDAGEKECGFRAICVAGQLEFSLVGILSELTGILAREGIPVRGSS